MLRGYQQTVSDDEDLELAPNIFMSDKSVHDLHSKGTFETGNHSVDRSDSRIQINNTMFQIDEIFVNSSDSQYEEFLLEVERANDEFFKNNSTGDTVNRYQPQTMQSNTASRNHGNHGNHGDVTESYLAMTAASKADFDYDTYEDDYVEEHFYDVGNGYEFNEGGEESCDGDEDCVDDDENDDFDDAIEMDPNEQLPVMKVQKVSAGYIINSNVYLTVPQWHALIPDADINQTYCVVCDEYIDFDTDNVHIEEEEHLDNFNLYKPLKRFELSITRLIRTKYHCGVCNELFDDRDDNNHVDTKKHGDNMLFAINKASDLVYDYHLDKSHDNSRYLEDNIEKQTHETMTYPLNNPMNNNTMSYSSCFTKPTSLNQLSDQASGYDHNYQSNDHYEQNFRSDDHYDQNFLSDDHYDHNDQPNGQSSGISYAAMAKKMKMDELPDLLKIDLGDKLVTVKFDSWHMVISTGLNQIYCMACQVTEHKRVKPEHCRSSTHLEKLMKCTVVQVYETHLIRKVGEKLYHCGHCNNLQPIDLMEEHVELYHPRNPRTPVSISKNTENHKGPSQVLEDNSVSNHVSVSANNNSTQEDLSDSNLRRLKMAGLSNTTVELTENPHRNTGVVPKMVAFKNQPEDQQKLVKVGDLNEVSSLTSPLTTKVDDQTKEKPADVGFFKSIWGEVSSDASKAYTDTPQTKPDTDMKIEASSQQIKEEKKFDVLTPQNSKEASPKPNEVTNSTEKVTIPSTSILNHLNPASNLTPIVNFQPDFAKTIYQFGYKLSVHILSLNAIIKMFYGDTKIQFYRCVFCDLDVEEPLLLEHMLDIRHVALIPTAPYMPEFSLHLIRRIRLFIHCAICNLVLPNDHMVVLTHNASHNHSVLLKRAIGFVPPVGLLQPPNQTGLIPPLPLPPLIPLPPSCNTNSPLLPHPPVGPTPYAVPPPVPTLAANVANGLSKSPSPSVSEEKCGTPDGKKAKKQTKAVTVTEEILVNYTEEYYLVKQRKQLLKVQRDSLNTIVYCGDGTLYCFVCETNIGTDESVVHIEDKSHRKCLTDSKMLSNYGNSLLRQIENMYHCATCNVIVQKKYLQRHLDWYKHLKNIETALCNTENDKLTENQDEITRIDIPTHKERLNVKDKAKFVIHFAFVIDKNHSRKDTNDNEMLDDDGDCEENIVTKRLNKIIIVKDEVFKLKWEQWHGLTTYKDGFKCKICAVDFDEEDWREHLQEPRHVTNLTKPFIEELGRDLLRQLSESKLHCLICNVELSTSDNICEHLDGKRHNKNRDQIIEESAKVNAYSDCDKDVIFL